MKQIIALFLSLFVCTLNVQAACDIDNPTWAQMRVGRVDQGIWAYWFCPGEYDTHIRMRYILAGAITDEATQEAIQWTRGLNPDFVKKPPTADGNEPRFQHLRVAAKAAMEKDEEFIKSIPIWVVSKNSSYPDRPMYTAEGALIKGKRTTVGQACECKVYHIKTSNQTRCPLAQLPGVPLVQEYTACSKLP